MSRLHRQPLRGTGKLQWGRDQLVAEIQREKLRIENQRAASMGPRPIGRGNPSETLIGDINTMLQWGRDQLVAEIAGQISASQIGSVLQWGRDQLVAEMMNALSSPIWRAGLQWGRDQLVAEITRSLRGVTRSTGLQWGRDQLVAEMPRGAKRLLIKLSGFNGAATNWSRKCEGAI